MEPLAKFQRYSKKRQGTTSVVPKEQSRMLGFSPCVFIQLYAIFASTKKVILQELQRVLKHLEGNDEVGDGVRSCALSAYDNE